MRINLLKRIPVALFTLSFTACSFLTPAATPSAADIEKEEQAIYSFFVGGGERTVLILQDTSGDISANDPQKSLDYIGLACPACQMRHWIISCNATSIQVSSRPT